jgi:hypothetical protein
MQLRASKHTTSRAQVLVALALGLAGTALILIAVFGFAEGETATHARLHLEASATVMAAAAAVALLWPKPRRRIEALARTALISTLSLLASAQLTESGGAFAWASDGETLESPALQVVHTTAAVIGAAALIGVAASSLAVLGAVAARR